MLFNKGSHAKLKLVQLQPSPLQGENGGKIYSAWNPGYTLSWGFRIKEMVTPPREELSPFVEQICGLRYKAVREMNGNPNFVIWSFAVINDLRAHDIGEE